MGVPTAFCLLGILTCSFFLGAKGVCLKGWLEHQDNCYRFVNEPVTWHMAEVKCQRVLPRGHLASILTAAETDFVSKYIKEKQKDKSNVWIGLNDIAAEGKWTWIDESIYKYKAWKMTEPTNPGKNKCVKLTSDSDFKQWINDFCEKLSPFICKQPSIGRKT